MLATRVHKLQHDICTWLLSGRQKLSQPNASLPFCLKDQQSRERSTRRGRWRKFQSGQCRRIKITQHLKNDRAPGGSVAGAPSPMGFINKVEAFFYGFRDAAKDRKIARSRAAGKIGECVGPLSSVQFCQVTQGYTHASETSNHDRLRYSESCRAEELQRAWRSCCCRTPTPSSPPPRTMATRFANDFTRARSNTLTPAALGEKRGRKGLPPARR